MSKVEIIKQMIKSGEYDWDAAVREAADRIMSNPEVLLWRQTMRMLKYILMTAIFVAMMTICAISASAETMSWADYEAACWSNGQSPSYEEYEDIAAGTDFMYDEEAYTLGLFSQED